MTLVSANVMFIVDIRGGSLVRGRQTTVDLSITAIFSAIAGYFFGNVRDKASIIIRLYRVPCRLFSDLKIHDLE